GCEVWIAEGTYLPGTERDSTFLVPVGVSLRGGFVGSETSARKRDIAQHRSVLSGNVGEVLSADDNTLHVVTTLGEATLDGLEVTSGNADDGTSGGGVLAGGKLTLLDCVISDNVSTANGGGIG